jgi:hypothetical protein
MSNGLPLRPAIPLAWVTIMRNSRDNFKGTAFAFNQARAEKIDPSNDSKEYEHGRYAQHDFEG